MATALYSGQIARFFAGSRRSSHCSQHETRYPLVTTAVSVLIGRSFVVHAGFGRPQLGFPSGDHEISCEPRSATLWWQPSRDRSVRSGTSVRNSARTGEMKPKQNWHESLKTVLFLPKQNAKTTVKRFSCFSQSTSVSVGYGLARKRRILAVIG